MFEIKITNEEYVTIVNATVETLAQATEIIETRKNDTSLKVTVWDTKTNEYVYFRFARQEEPETDLIWDDKVSAI